MTTAIFIIITLAFFITALNMLPVADATFSTDISNAIFYFVKIIKGWNWLFAVDTLFQAFLIILAYEIIIWTWFHIMFPIIKFIRGSTH